MKTQSKLYVLIGALMVSLAAQTPICATPAAPAGGGSSAPGGHGATTTAPGTTTTTHPVQGGGPGINKDHETTAGGNGAGPIVNQNVPAPPAQSSGGGMQSR